MTKSAKNHFNSLNKLAYLTNAIGKYFSTKPTTLFTQSRPIKAQPPKYCSDCNPCCKLENNTLLREAGFTSIVHYHSCFNQFHSLLTFHIGPSYFQKSFQNTYKGHSRTLHIQNPTYQESYIFERSASASLFQKNNYIVSYNRFQ